jgi:hypothetical protein
MKITTYLPSLTHLFGYQKPQLINHFISCSNYICKNKVPISIPSPTHLLGYEKAQVMNHSKFKLCVKITTYLPSPTHLFGYQKAQVLYRFIAMVSM